MQNYMVQKRVGSYFGPTKVTEKVYAKIQLGLNDFGLKLCV